MGGRDEEGGGGGRELKEKERVGVVEGLFPFLFLFGWRRRLGGEGVGEAVEGGLGGVRKRRKDGTGAMGGKERGGRGEGGLKVRRGRFWEGNFGVGDVEGEGWEGGFRFLLRFLDFFLSSGGKYSSSELEEGGAEGERGEEGGEIGEKGMQG